MALRALSPLGYFPCDVPIEEVCNVPKILAVSEHAILWRQSYPISLCQESSDSEIDAEFPAAARRLLLKDPLSNPVFPWTFHHPYRYGCRLFLTPLAPMTSRQLALHATCVLPVPVPICDMTYVTAAFATATRLFVPIRVLTNGLAIVSFTSSSPLFDGDINYEVSMFINFPGLNNYDVSLTVEEPGPLSDPDHISLLSYEDWHGSNIYKRCSFRYVASRSTGGVISCECVMEHSVDSREICGHGGDAAKKIARLAGRRPLSNYDLNYLKSARFTPAQENRIFEPVRLFTNDYASSEELMLLLPGGQRIAFSRELKSTGRRRRKNLLENIVSAASSREGRVVLRLENTVYSGFFGGALPRLEEASQAACYELLSEQQKQRLLRASSLDFSSFLQFCGQFGTS